MVKNISILGSTGSVGVQTLDIVKRHPDRFKVVGLAAGSNIDVLASQVKEFRPEIVSVKNGDDIYKLKSLLGHQKVDIVFGEEGAVEVASISSAHLVMSAIVGASGLVPTLSALKLGKTVGLANKESMVIAGELMSREANASGALILPVDSEHSAIFQCLEGQKREALKKIILTASGGPFLHKPLAEFPAIKIKEALKHPNWDMGAKITIDSATMMNKGLEVMEARWLFNVGVDQIEVCIHPQSIIHSMVEYIDSSVIAQMGLPDMRVPIAYAMSYPERIETGVTSLNLYEKRELTFFEPDTKKFPALKLAFEVAEKAKTYPAVLNASNEVAVDAFLKEKVGFQGISKLVEKVISEHTPIEPKTLEDILEADRWAREIAETLISRFAA